MLQIPPAPELDRYVLEILPVKRVMHELNKYIKSVSAEMADDYETILGRVKEDPGTAGDQGEENWKDLFEAWLPPIFQIVTKGKILGHDGQLSPQVDVIILRPEYPKKLLNKKYYLAGGVIGAFECKITLKSGHFDKFFKNSEVAHFI